MPEPSDVEIRLAEERDLDALAEFEVRIAQVSFAEDAVSDPAYHRAKLWKAMGRDRAGMLVAQRPGTGEVAGWLWVSINRNFTTRAVYANFRSLAVRQGEPGDVAETLFRRGLEYARGCGAVEVVGQVHVDNVPMRLLYRRFGFEPQHLRMRHRLPPGPGA